MKTLNSYLRLQTIILSVLIIITTGCSEKFNIDLPTSFTRLVVFGSITTDTTAQQVRLTTTSSYFSDEAPVAVSGARVYISDNKGDTFQMHESQKAGYYLTDPNVYGIAGRKYSLHIRDVSVGGRSSWDSQPDSMPTVKKVDSIAFKLQPDWGSKGVWEINVYAQDPTTTDYYVFKVWKNDTLLSDSLNNLFITDDLLFNGHYTNGISSQFLNQSNPDEVVRNGDKITFELNSVSKGYLYFINDFLTSAGPSIPFFSGPPANVPTNMNNDAIGYFSAYSVYKISRKIHL